LLVTPPASSAVPEAIGGTTIRLRSMGPRWKGREVNRSIPDLYVPAAILNMDVTAPNVSKKENLRQTL
jgi:hypothetical protein